MDYFLSAYMHHNNELKKDIIRRLTMTIKYLYHKNNVHNVLKLNNGVFIGTIVGLFVTENGILDSHTKYIGDFTALSNDQLLDIWRALPAEIIKPED